jgi:RHS repeat-associated protein
VLVDNQFKYVQGGVVQVTSGSSKQALVASLQTMSKNGYVYVYVSNESPQDVYFDDVTVKHYTGALVQEQSYYLFGVQMMAISDKALKKGGTPYKYNAGSEMEDELEYYNTFYRKYDAQIGRFTGVDILSEMTIGTTPYHFGSNNPVYFNDPTGAMSDDPDPEDDPAYVPTTMDASQGWGYAPGSSGGYSSSFGSWSVGSSWAFGFLNSFGGGGGGGGSETSSYWSKYAKVIKALNIGASV